MEGNLQRDGVAKAFVHKVKENLSVVSLVFLDQPDVLSLVEVSHRVSLDLMLGHSDVGHGLDVV